MVDPSREIIFEGCYNVRDLGGYRTADGRATRWRRLFRSDHTALLSGADCRRMERDLGIRTLVDLRTSAMHQEFPPKLAVRCVNLPLFGDEAVEVMRAAVADASARTFMRAIRDRATHAVIAGAFALFAQESSYPLAFHCITGKDRTGLIAALVLGVLGVADDDIVRDYAMTETNMPRYIERLRERGRLPADGSFTEELPRSFFETPPAAMRSLLEDIRARHGSIRGYVASCGVDAATLAALEQALLSDVRDT